MSTEYALMLGWFAVLPAVVVCARKLSTNLYATSETADSVGRSNGNCRCRMTDGGRCQLQTCACGL